MIQQSLFGKIMLQNVATLRENIKKNQETHKKEKKKEQIFSFANKQEASLKDLPPTPSN